MARSRPVSPYSQQLQRRCESALMHRAELMGDASALLRARRKMVADRSDLARALRQELDAARQGLRRSRERRT